MRLHPFRALRPRPEVADQVAAVPYDVVNRAEAAELARGNPRSFLHVGRSDIDLPEEVDAYDPRIYLRAREALDQFVLEGTLLRDREPALYLYRQTMDGREQVGVVGCVHVDDYERDLTAPDGVRHTVWQVAASAGLARAFEPIPHSYVADGHHRSASAWRAGKELRGKNSRHQGDEEYNWFLAVLFPSEQLRILPYNRVVRDLNGLEAETVLERLRGVGRVQPASSPDPDRPGVFGVYLGGRWYRLELDPASIDRSDPIASLDVALLQDRVLGPILGIGDPRTDKRIDFVGGIRGPAELARRVDSGEMAVAFALYPTSLEQLMAVSDAGQVMPPKSTWFEPKLRSGLFVHELE
jgi:uncharacterized protein (DUF1015 family)